VDLINEIERHLKKIDPIGCWAIIKKQITLEKGVEDFFLQPLFFGHLPQCLLLVQRD
jgi:hypothetical protein